MSDSQTNAAIVSATPDPGARPVSGSTLRTRRRRARLRNAGLTTVSYDLPIEVADGVARTAQRQGLSDSEYITRLASADILRARSLSKEKET